MEIMGSPLIDHFDFNYEARVSPYLSVPSSPKRFGEIYMSAPTSPSRISEFYSEFEYFSITSPTPKDDYHDGFAFLVGESEKSPRSAEELFHDGRIKPLKEDNDLLFESAKSPLLSRKHVERSAIEQGKKVIREAFSPRRNNRESEATRGRDKTPSITSSNSNNRHRVARSHSPCREPRYTWVEESQQGSNKEDSNKASLTSSSSKGSRKWRLRDFLLFRSASEGRGSSKDPLRKYPILFKKAEEGKGSSFRSSGSDNPPRPRRKEPLSAHELHYARKKAETEDMKKKTFLPYKQGILGRLAGFTR
ncbi:PREDICTED: uncharacterized protein LOC109327988 isoform X2 [Lupinus angustifolius]|uniref:uncharacterized protein LOC109327988 isoform X2 n=1 Tax=Lupinus angustifolius TaxID=3871 RepID=UPI00092FD285|nr:PREDICTED: uncharacterized protein LOC109327988 isoform X2 [Lupinus angustifolius]